MTDFYFAYGSNMCRSRLESRIGDVEHIGAACIENFRLVFNKPSRDGSGKANLLSADGTATWGVVFRIGVDRFTTLDGFEPGYARIGLPVRLHGAGAVEVDVYLHAGTGPEIPPFAWYIDHMIEGARDSALPPDWIEALLLARGQARPGRHFEV